MKKSPIKGFVGLYEITMCGEIYSLDRIVIGKDGVHYPFKGKRLCQGYNKSNNTKVVHLWKNGKEYSFYVHRLVAETFIPNPENKPEVNHIDGDRINNHYQNLEWVTSSENKNHAIQTGLKVYSNRLTESEFIECLWAVINGESYAQITLRVPYKVPFLSTKLRKLAKEKGLEDLLNESLYNQRIKRARINGRNNS